MYVEPGGWLGTKLDDFVMSRYRSIILSFFNPPLFTEWIMRQFLNKVYFPLENFCIVFPRLDVLFSCLRSLQFD